MGILVPDSSWPHWKFIFQSFYTFIWCFHATEVTPFASPRTVNNYQPNNNRSCHLLITTGLLSTKYWRWLFHIKNSTLGNEKRWTKQQQKVKPKQSWTFQFGCSMIPKGCQYTIFLGLIGTPRKVLGEVPFFPSPLSCTLEIVLQSAIPALVVASKSWSPVVDVWCVCCLRNQLLGPA